MAVVSSGVVEIKKLNRRREHKAKVGRGKPTLAAREFRHHVTVSSELSAISGHFPRCTGDETPLTLVPVVTWAL